MRFLHSLLVYDHPITCIALINNTCITCLPCSILHCPSRVFRPVITCFNVPIAHLITATYSHSNYLFNTCLTCAFLPLNHLRLCPLLFLPLHRDIPSSPSPLHAPSRLFLPPFHFTISAPSQIRCLDGRGRMQHHFLSSHLSVSLFYVKAKR